MTDQMISDIIPREMLVFAEHSVQQARKAFDELMSVTHHAVSTFEGQASSAKTNAREFQRKILEFSERNVAASLEFGQKLLQAKDSEQVLGLHAEYVHGQMQALTEQMREIGEHAAKTAVPQTGSPATAASQDHPGNGNAG